MGNITTQSIVYFFVALAVSALIAPIIIKLLYKFNLTVEHRLMKDKSNEQFHNLHKHKSGTPNMGGILIWIVALLLTLPLMGVNQLTITFSGIFFLWGLIGLIDSLIVTLKKSDLKFRQLQESFEWRLGKLILLAFVAIVSSFLIFNYPTIQPFDHLSFFGIAIDLPEILLILAVGILMVFGIYAFEITDGLDGLLAGLTIQSLSAFFFLLTIQGQYGLLPIIGIILGVLCVYLYFNIPPARVFMGGVGAMPLGAMMLFLAVISDNLFPYILISLLMWIELASSAMQIISIRFFKHKIFRLAPLHHHFEALGWPETKVTMRFWLFHGIFCIGGILIGLL
jgi:phospho-N-acetylmuramoyl-pentapeptide-transferase